MSTPSHPRFGKHLSSAEVNELVKPCDDTLEQVHDWLRSHDIDTAKLSYTPAKDWINVKLPIAAIERLLDTQYSIYKHEDGTHIVRAPSWSLPTHLHNHIETIQPTNSFFRPDSRRRAFMTKPLSEVGEELMKSVEYVPPKKGLTIAEACNVAGITPTCLRTLYGTIDYIPKVPDKNQIALTNFLGETSNRSDISIFLQTYRPDAVNAAYTFGIEQINGGNNQQAPDDFAQLSVGKDLEGNLDAETILGIGYPTPLLAYNTGGMPPFQPDAANPTDTNEVCLPSPLLFPAYLLIIPALSRVASIHPR